MGRGGMGAVYKGTQVVLDRPVAIKLLPAEIAADEQFIARFHREARTLARLQHSRIITIHDFGQTREGHFYFVMEYIDGTDLRKILRGPGLNPDQALLVVGQICDALHAAHSQGVIHRDIKPENILERKDGYVKLADFGLSRPLKEQGPIALTGTNVVMGTADYMAPEQREGQADERADIFALGVMLYEMLTGRTPRGAFEPASRKVQLDVRIDEVVLKALQAEPDTRYQRVSDMKTDVDRIRNTPPRPAAPVAIPRPAPAPPSKKRRKALANAAFLAPIFAIAGYFTWEKRARLSLGPTRTMTPSPSASSAASRETLEEALLTHPWRWNAMDPDTFPWKEVVFLRDGTMRSSSSQTVIVRWKITGPSSVAVQTTPSDRILLGFYPALDYFTSYREDGRVMGSGQKVDRQNVAPPGKVLAYPQPGAASAPAAIPFEVGTMRVMPVAQEFDRSRVISRICSREGIVLAATGIEALFRFSGTVLSKNLAPLATRANRFLRTLGNPNSATGVRKKTFHARLPTYFTLNARWIRFRCEGSTHERERSHQSSAGREVAATGIAWSRSGGAAGAGTPYRAAFLRGRGLGAAGARRARAVVSAVPH